MVCFRRDSVEIESSEVDEKRQDENNADPHTDRLHDAKVMR